MPAETHYIKPNMLTTAGELFQKEMITFSGIKDYFLNVLEFDNTKDLTDILPRDRTNVSVHVMFLYDHIESTTEIVKEKFSNTIEFIKNMPGVFSARGLAIGPKSIVPLHLDDMERKAFDLNDWYSVLIGIEVPSDDPNLLAVEVDKCIYTHDNKKSIIFDTQIPHSAWNNTDEWWVILKLYIKKECFNENIDP